MGEKQRIPGALHQEYLKSHPNINYFIYGHRHRTRPDAEQYRPHPHPRRLDKLFRTPSLTARTSSLRILWRERRSYNPHFQTVNHHTITTHETFKSENMIAGCPLAAGALPVWGQSGAPTWLSSALTIRCPCIPSTKPASRPTARLKPAAWGDARSSWYPGAIKMPQVSRLTSASPVITSEWENAAASADPPPQPDGRERLFLPDDVPLNPCPSSGTVHHGAEMGHQG